MFCAVDVAVDSFPTISAAVRSHAASRGGQPALSAGGEELSYGDLARQIRALTGRFARLGVAPGDRVVVLGQNSIEWVLAFLACLECGAVAVPMNQRLSQVEIGEQIRRVEPALVLTDADGLDTVAAPAAAACGAQLRALGRDFADPRSIWREKGLDIVPDLPPPDAPALIAFTSGSTGVPKGAVISHGALAQASRAGALAVGTTASDRTLIMVPLFHNTGFADQLGHMLMVGGAIDLLPVFGVRAARRALVRRPATYVIAVPGVLRLLTESEDAAAMFAECRIACFGGSPMPEAWIHDMGSRWPGLGLFNIYGLTEFTSLSHCLQPRDLLAHGDSVGLPVDGAEQLVVDPDGEPVATGETGMILVAGPSRMSEYWRAPEQTREALRGRWLVTGDIGSVSEEGFLRLTGRASEVINRGGEKISPTQVEAAVNLEPAVAEAGVVGAPHPIFGERVVAFVTLAGASGLDEDATRQRLRKRIADYAVPERFFVVDELPRTAAGKVDRLELRRHAAAALAAPVSPQPTASSHTDPGSQHGTPHT
jgi:long-chain acyl-CoA synthetase